MNGIAIVHVSTIGFNPQDFFEKVVKRVRQQERICLRNLTAKTKTYFSEIQNETVGKLPQPWVMEPLFCFPE